MEVTLHRSMKAYCPDFAPVRKALLQMGATKAAVKEQVDYFYNLPSGAASPETRRLKLRDEGGEVQIVYFYDRQGEEGGNSAFKQWELTDSHLKDVLDAALGVRAVVRKRRELWRKGSAVFHLDTVEGVGQVFEVELLAESGIDIDVQVEKCRRIFGPYLGDNITGSNEDLVAQSS